VCPRVITADHVISQSLWASSFLKANLSGKNNTAAGAITMDSLLLQFKREAVAHLGFGSYSSRRPRSTSGTSFTAFSFS
jgi:hypothetical protein